MSSSAYYNFATTTTTTRGSKQAAASPNCPLEAQRRAAMSPSASSVAASSASNSSSSLYQLNSYVPTSSSSSSSSSASSVSSSSSRTSHHLRRQWSQMREEFGGARHLAPLSAQRQEENDDDVTSGQNLRSHLHKTCNDSTTTATYTLHSLEPKPLKPYKTNSEYLEAMREDLAEWLNRLYPELDLTPENFFARLETGAIICRHANQVTRMGRQHQQEQVANNSSLASMEDSFSSMDLSKQSSSATSSQASPTNTTNNSSRRLTSVSLSSQRSLDLRSVPINWFQVRVIPFRADAQPGTFMARDNICQFILWCRSLNILECLLFETDDLVARKNEKSFILCLLEVARIGFKVGMPTPLIIQLEQEIDREIENDAKQQLLLSEEEEEMERGQKQNGDDDDTIDSFGCDTSDDCYSSSLVGEVNIAADNQDAKEEEKEQQKEEEEEEEEEEEDSSPKPQVITNDLLSLHEKVVQLLCLCTCPTQFPMVRVGEGKYKVGDKLIIFVRILRRHIMVRVGGGWQELSEFLRLKDPCRSKSPFSPLSLNNHQHHQAATKLTSNSRSRLGESSHHLNIKSHNNNFRNANTSYDGQRLISGSASMSWLSHNS